MKLLFNLLKWEIKLLHRQQLIVLSLVVAGIYLGIFYLFHAVESLSTVLILLIFNDPVVTSLLFSGVIILFEKNQGTLQAVQLFPIKKELFYASKIIAISGLSFLSAVFMTWAAIGFSFNYFHYLFAVAGSCIWFTSIGLVLGIKARSFNYFLIYILGVILPMVLPFFALFDIMPTNWALIFPSYPALILLQASFTDDISTTQLFYAYSYQLVLIIGIGSYAFRYLKTHQA